MVTPVGMGPYAVGLRVGQRGDRWYFGDAGSNWGFRCRLVGHFRKGYGMAAMTNRENGIPVLDEIEARVASAYDWDSLDKRATFVLGAALAIDGGYLA
jgi:hypothetical protein